MMKTKRFLSTLFAIAVASAMLAGPTSAIAQEDPYAPPEKSALPPSDMTLDLERTALLITDPQIDFLSEKGVTWGIVGESVTEQNTVVNIGCASSL